MCMYTHHLRGYDHEAAQQQQKEGTVEPRPLGPLVARKLTNPPWVSEK